MTVGFQSTLKAQRPFLAILVGVSACSSPEPEIFSRRQDIPIADWTVNVRSSDLISPLAMGGKILDDYLPEKAWLAVHAGAKYQGTDGADIDREFRRLLSNLWLEDAEASKYEVAIAPLTESHFQMLKLGNQLSFEDLQGLAYQAEMDMSRGRWVLVFLVDKESRGFRLLIDNYAPRNGQSRRAAIDLGQ